MENKFGLTGRKNQNYAFEGKNINSLSSREAMGLDLTYSPSKIDSLSEIYDEFATCSKEDLMQIIGDSKMPFLKRFSAGNLLGLKGDPRIDTFDPHMVEVKDWEGQLGLRKDEVVNVVTEYAQYGVLYDWINKETPLYDVQIKRFKMGKYLITNQEYLEFLIDTNYEEIPTSWPFGQFVAYLANHPVHTLSSEACIKYAEWLSEKTNRKFRLPTESEWEFTAGGPNSFEFPWGNQFEKDKCNTVESGIMQTTPVGVFPAGVSPFGCLDMAGNVEEYVADYYKPYEGGEMVMDDLAVKNERFRVARGGSFTRFRDLSRCKRRHGRYENEIYVMGFRLAEDY